MRLFRAALSAHDRDVRVSGPDKSTPNESERSPTPSSPGDPSQAEEPARRPLTPSERGRLEEQVEKISRRDPYFYPLF